jgi:DNA (cytosine-5)-methyltransferase 1
VSGHPSPRREKGQSAPTIPSRSSAGGGLGTDFDCDGGLIDVAPCLNATYGEQTGQDYMNGLLAFGAQNSASQGDGVGEIVATLDKSKTPAIAFSIMPQNSGKDYKAKLTDVAQPIMAGGPVGGNQGGDYVVQPVPIDMRQASRGDKLTNNRATGSGGAPGHGVGDAGDPAFTVSERGQAVAFADLYNGTLTGDVAATMGTRGSSVNASGPTVLASAVRRLTPRECERLQGFPDDYTLIPWRNGMASDGPRYKALGNSMAVPCMAWIGRRIQAVEDLIANEARAA